MPAVTTGSADNMVLFVIPGADCFELTHLEFMIEDLISRHHGDPKLKRFLILIPPLILYILPPVSKSSQHH